MLDGESIPVYTADFVLLKGDDFNKAMMSANFIPEPYVDNDKVVKLFLLRIASEQEKSQMIQYQEEGSLNNEFIGKPALPFSVTDLLGNAYSIDKLKGKLIVINFWFVECKPCIMEMPDLNKLVEKYKKGTKPESDASQEEVATIQSLLFETINQTKSDFNAGIFKNYQEFTSASGFTMRNVGDALAFNYYHEGMHIGMMMSIRKFI